MRRSRQTLVSTVAVGSVFLAWLVVGENKLVDPLLLPGPREVFETATTLITDGYRQVPLWQHVLVSLARGMAAFAAAAATGIPLGLMMGRFATLNAIFDPFVQFLRPLPKLALIPLVIVWFGIGEFSKFLLIYLSTFLTVVVSAAAAVTGVQEDRIRAAQSLGVSRTQLFRFVILPSAMPELFTGVRVAIGIGWTTLIAAEMIASSSGLGWMVINASSYLRTDVVLLGILLLGGVGYLLDLALVTAQRMSVHWSGKG
ncbi:ABC transporter permease subunit [Variovorax paradoxus]|uniref:ABC transporter permease subunit n=1 Tax=Variovorax paradoxus TaxID=34073 RepID=UPI0019314F09|nr:ABC transporter permease subunit [Variovorax paradoxus]